MRPADEDTVRGWLGNLGVLCAASMSAEEARARLGAFAHLLTDDYPIACFTPRTLAAAGRRFKFWPAFAELCAFLDETRGEQRAKVDRLQALAAPSRASRTEPIPEPVDIEERQRVGALFGLLGKAMTSGDFSEVNAACVRINRPR